ncbi:MAG: hypothetical protein Q9P44_15180 [Anaerolineae bacterium]|nr:hypothetical protein [Anaerolineae bacterium]
MGLIVMLVGIFALLFVLSSWRGQQQVVEPTISTIDGSALQDPMLAYHLDWDILRDERFRFYLFVKKINAVKRYENLAGVSHEQAQKVIATIIANEDLMARLRPMKKRPHLPLIEEQRLRDLVARGQFVTAENLYQQIADVDLYTAQRAISRLEREVYVENVDDPDIRRLIARSESDAIDLARRRYRLTQKEAIFVVDMMQAEIENSP